MEKSNYLQSGLPVSSTDQQVALVGVIHTRGQYIISHSTGEESFLS